MLWAISSTVRPSWACRSSSRLSTVACTETSSARHRLVGHEHLGLERERAGDADPLALAARELARVGVQARAPSPTRSSSSRQRASTRSRGTSSCTRSSSDSVWRTVMRGFSDEYGSWKTIWIRRRWAAVRFGAQRLALEAHRRPPSAPPARRGSGRASTCRSPTRPRARASRRGRSRGRRRRPRAAPRAGVSLVVHREPADLEQRLRHRRSPAPARRRPRRPRDGCRPSPRSAPSARSGKSPLVQSSCANGQRGWNGQPGGGDGEVGRRARDRGQPLADRGRSPGTERSRLSVYGWRGCAEHRRPRCPVSTTWPPYITATRWQVWAITARSCETKTSATPSSLAQRAQQLEDLVLDRHVERGRRLVAQDQPRVAGQRDGDHHALAQAAGQLVRVRPRAPRGVGDADQPHQLERAVAAPAPPCGRAAGAASRRSGRRRA